MAKHNWILDKDGNPDEWAWESGFHNGVACRDCGFHVCVHCSPDWFEMDGCLDPGERKPITNADRVRAMIDDRLKYVILCPLEFSGLVECPDVPNCTICKQRWLQQPAEAE